MVEPVLEQFESFHILVPPDIQGEWSPPLFRTGVHTVRRLPSMEVMLSSMSSVIFASPTSCIPSHVLSFIEIIDISTTTQLLTGMFVEDAGSPELFHMAFNTCHRQDTGEAVKQSLLLCSTVSAFTKNLLAQPSKLDLTVLYFVRFRCGLCLCKRNNFTPPHY